MTKTNATPANKTTIAAQPKASSGVASPLTYRALEPRVVFDGAGVALIADAVKHQDKVVDTHGPAATADPAHVAIDQQHDSLVAALRGGAGTAQHDATAQIVFIENNLPDVATLLKDVPQDATVVMLDSTKDGMDQIAQYLAGRSGIGAIHILSHGAAGEVDLGTGTLTTASLAGKYAADIATIKAALAPNADILLYGCDVAQGSAGHAFIQALATATGDNVAASTDITGAASLGGNWVLEDHVGTIHNASVSAADWNGELSAAAGNGKGALLTVTGNSIYSVDIGTGKATLVTTVPASVGGVAFSGVANSLAVDQADGLIYYTDNSGSPTNKALFAYDFVHDKHILITSNVSDYGIVVAPDNGVGFSGATFANNTLYFGIDNPSGTEDGIYAVKFSNGGTTVTSATHLNTTLPLTNDWGDIGYDPINNNLLSFSAPDLSVTRIDPTTGATIGTGLPMPAGSGYQGSQDVAGNVYAVGAAIQQINPLTGAAIGPSITVTTDGSTAVGGANDAAGWTPPTAMIEGRVYWDNNTNKISDAGDAPAANVTVQLYTDVNNDGVINGQDKLLATDTTDANGQYQFTNALPGDYIVKVTDGNGVIGTHSYSTTGGAINTSGHVAIIGSTISNIDFGVANTVTAANDTFATYDNTPVTIKATANDSDPQGEAFTITAVNGTAFSASSTSIVVAGGSVALDASDNLVFTPNTGYNGSPSFTYTVTDALGATATATVSGTVSYAPPIAVNDTFTTNANTPVVIDARANDTDVNGFPLTITKIGTTAITAGGAAVAVTDGTVKLNTDGTLTFAPTANYTGAVPAFTYIESDGHGGTATATVSGSVVDVPPIATDDTFTTAQGTAVAITALTNDTSPVGLPLTVTKINATAIAAGGAAVAIDHGSVALSAAGVLTFTPTAGYSGPEAFTYTLSDGHGGTDVANVTGTIYAPPTLTANTFGTAKNTTVTIPVLANDTDVNGFPLTVNKIGSTSITAGGAAVAVTDGTVKLDASGNLIFTPTTGYTGGVPSFTYTVSDGHGGTATTTIIGTVYAPPVAVANTFATTTDLPFTVNVLGNDSDPNGFALNIDSVNGTAITAGGPGVPVTGGNVTMDTAGYLTFTPDAAYNGSSSFTYSIDDGHGGTATTTVSGTISPLNHPPVNVVPDDQVFTGSTLVLSTANGNAVQVTDDASATAIIQTTVSVDTGTLTLKQATGLAFVAGDGTADATITIKGTKAAINAALDGMTYNAPAGNTATGHLTISTNDLGQPNGEDIPNGSFETTLTTVADGAQRIMNQSQVPGWTTTAPDSQIEIWGTGFLGVAAYEGHHFAELNANFAAADVSVSTIAKGQSLDFSFAHRGRQGVDVMNVTVIDAGVDGVFGTADDATLMNQNYSDGNTAWGAYQKDLGVASGNPVKLVFTSVSSAGGNSTVGNFLDAVHLGTTHLTDTDTVLLSKLPPPVAVNDTFGTAAGAPVTIPVVSNDTDVNGFHLTVTQINGINLTAGGAAVAVTDGTVNLNADGTLTFTPTTGYTGAVPTFNYTVSDGHGGTATATVTGTVYSLPVASDDLGAGTAGAPVTVAVLANDTDASGTLNPASVQLAGTSHAGDSLTVSGEGTWSVNTTTGAITFMPLAGFSGAPTTVNYAVSDNHGTTSNTATVSVLPLASDPHLDLSGQAPWTGAFLYSHGGAPYAGAAWKSAPGLARFTSVGPEVAGSGVALSYDGSSVDISGIGSTSLSGAISAHDYISMSFTTTTGVPETWIQNTVNRNTGSTVEFGVAISTDGFKSAALLSDHVPGTNYAGPFYGNGDYPWQPATDFKLAANTTYELRVYLYNAPTTTARWDDFYVFYSNDPVNYASTFIEAGTPARIADPGVTIEDTNNTTLASSLVTLTNQQAADQFLVSGRPVADGSSGDIGTIHYAVTDANGVLSIALTGQASFSAYQNALAAITFQNTSSQPDPTDRIVNVTVNDGLHESNLATTTIRLYRSTMPRLALIIQRRPTRIRPTP